MKNRLFENEIKMICVILLSTELTKLHNFPNCWRRCIQNSWDMCWKFIQSDSIKKHMFNLIFLCCTLPLACSNSSLYNWKDVDNPTLIVIIKISKKFHTNVTVTQTYFAAIACQIGIFSLYVNKYGISCFTNSTIASLSVWQLITKCIIDPTLSECSTAINECLKSQTLFLI